MSSPLLPPIELEDGSTVPRILAAILDVVRAEVEPLATDRVTTLLRDPGAGRIDQGTVVSRVQARLAGQDVDFTIVANAIMALVAAGWLRLVRDGPASFYASYTYLPGPLSGVLPISDAHEVVFATAQAERRARQLPWPAPTP